MAKKKATRRPASNTTTRKDDPQARRLVADVPAAIYTAVRVRCAKRNIGIKKYILELLQRDGIA